MSRPHPRSLLLGAGLALAAALSPTQSAQAARHEVSFEFSDVSSLDGTYNDLGVWRIPRFGLRAGYAALDHHTGFGLTALASYHHGRRGGGVYVENDSQDFAYNGQDTRYALTVDAWGVGAKADYDVRGFFFPYVRVDAEVQLTTFRVADQVYGTDDADPNRIKTSGVAPAGAFVGGFEFMLPDRTWGWPVTAGLYVEMGYEVTGQTRLGELGSVNASGVLVRSGLGLRF